MVQLSPFNFQAHQSSARFGGLDLIQFSHILARLYVVPSLYYLLYPYIRIFKMFGSKKFSPDTDISDQTGKVILITGGTFFYQSIVTC
jgi:hypothetical protein